MSVQPTPRMPSTDRSTHLPEPVNSPATAVLHRAAGDVRPGIEALIADIVAQLREAEPFYRSPGLAPTDVADAVREGLLIALDAVAIPGLSGRSARFAWQLGSASGGRGVPLTPLIRGYRIAARLLWEALARAIVERHPDDASVLVPVASTFWDVVDRDTRLLADAHAGAPGEPAAGRADRVRSLLGMLLDGSPDEAGVASVAAELGVAERSRIAVAVLRNRIDHRAGPIDEPPGMRILRTVRNRVEVVIALLGDRPLADLAGMLRGVRGTRIGVSPVVDGLAHVGRALRLAEVAVLTCTKDGEVACLDARLPAGLLVSAPDVARELAGTVLRPVLGLQAVDRDLLLTTLAAWLECDGSARRAAARLYCHRNTVVNRLRRLEQLAQRSLARPRDLVELTLALDALQLGRPDSGRTLR